MFKQLEPKIYVRLTGQLGNQLFCYACGRILSLKLGWPLVLDKSPYSFDNMGRIFLLDQYNINADKISEKPIKPGRAIWPFREKIVRFREPKLSDLTDEQYKEGHSLTPLSNEVLDATFDCSVILTGFWQSEGYFKDYEELIKKELTPKLSIPQKTLDEVQKIVPERSVCLGFRRWHEFAKGKHSHHSLSEDYYTRAIELISQQIENPIFHILCTSEDKEWVEKNIPGSENFHWVTHYPRNEEAYINLWLMTHFKNFIIANSTYHWWGAWLSHQEDKKIISPKLGWTSMSPQIEGSIVI
ncbi:MAG: alpha-1,2-fucosyltransferase [Opitutales bacterium]|nr:alpha-1,2-fucosyltransferase [Opitutales bacterium]